MKWSKLFKPDKKTALYLIALCAAGILLVWLSVTFGKKDDAPKDDAKAALFTAVMTGKTEDAEVSAAEQTLFSSENELESRLEEILSEVYGAGEVRVMITFSESAESVFAKQSGDDAKIISLRDKSGTETPVALKEISPKISGVLAVAKGGGDIVVRDALTKAIEAVLGVEPHKIQILKMK